jgi:hypothetical protein
MRRIWDLDQDTFNLVAGAFLLTIIIFFLWCFGQYNQLYIVTTDTNVHVIDKYHEREYCDSEGYCDPEHFVVIFDNHETLDLRERQSWSEVRLDSLWHFHKEQGRLWTINKEAYPL